MKWPLSLTIIRHGESAYNVLKVQKKGDPEYQTFAKLFEKHENPARLKTLANKLQKRYSTGVSDYDTPLTKDGVAQATKVGKRILELVPRPDVVFVSPYKRTRATYEALAKSAKIDKGSCKEVFDDRIREQEHGLSLLYNDWRIFETMHPEQCALRTLQGSYWYQYPQGESVSMVRERIRSFMTMLVREYPGKHVWIVSHHLTLLSVRANLERLSPEQFQHIDENDKPINCGVTLYEGRPKKGKNGRLVLKSYNNKLY